MNFKPYRALSVATLTAVIALGVWSAPQSASAKDKQTIQDPQGCHTTPIPVPEPGWLTLLAAGAAPVAFSIKRRLGR